MKKTILAFSVCMAVIFFTKSIGQAPKTSDVTVFFVDRYMHCLIPVDHKIPSSTTQNQAEEIMNILCTPVKENSSFIRYITSKINVKTKGETATVNLPKNAIDIIPKDRDNQMLFIYQIVNSLCSIPEINYVRFTVDGTTKENPFTFINIKDIFSSNYEI